MTLYPDEMNIYGDNGNLLVLQKRTQWHGFDVEIVRHEVGSKFDSDVDIIIGGGGQDSGQDKITDDLLKNGNTIKKLASSGVPMLVICGMYQLFGKYFETDSHRIDGIGLFDAYTKAGEGRLIGNVVVETEFGDLVGYENHSGLTTLGKTQKPLGVVLKGGGNNGTDKTEGARIYNVFGSYLHGPLLPKNPMLADELIKLAAINKFGEFKPQEIDDSIAIKAHDIAATRPR